MALEDSTWQMTVVKPWLFVLLAACSRDLAGGSADGPTVFAAYCAPCHGPQGKPSDVMIARMNVRDLTSPELRSRVTPALVEAQVRNGSQNKLMPAFKDTLKEPQIKAVAAYVASPQFLSL